MESISPFTSTLCGSVKLLCSNFRAFNHAEASQSLNVWRVEIFTKNCIIVHVATPSPPPVGLNYETVVTIETIETMQK